MDIGPISAIRPIALVKPSASTPDLSRVFEVEYLGQSRDDQYCSANKKAARGLEDEEGDVQSEESAEPEASPEAVAGSAKVSFFA